MYWVRDTILFFSKRQPIYAGRIKKNNYVYITVRIGGVGILGDLDQFAKSVEEAANQKREEDEILTGVPDEFLDPIMSTVMMDPVILPSSKITVDRQTIARY